MAELAEHTGKLGRNGGVVAGVVLGTLSGVFTLAAGGSKAEAAQMVYGAAVPYGETQIDLARGDLLAAEKSAIVETASNLGSLGGAAAGAAIGTLILPGVGTVIGAGIGALGGGIGAGYFAQKIHDNKPVLDMQTAFNALPNNVTPDMPPEVAALVEVKASRELFEKNFAEIESYGGLSEVQAYIEAHPLEVKPKAPVPENISIPAPHLFALGMR